MNRVAERCQRDSSANFHYASKRLYFETKAIKVRHCVDKENHIVSVVTEKALDCILMLDFSRDKDLNTNSLFGR